MSEIKEEDIEQYLIDNPKYVEKWISLHGTQELLEKLLAKKEELDSSPTFRQGPRNSITSNIFKSYVEGAIKKKKVVRRSKIELLNMPEQELFMELIKDIASELDVNTLCHKILQNVSILTNSDRGSLFLVKGSKEKRYLVSKLFDVTETSTLEESVHTESNEIKVPFGKGIAGLVAQTKEPVNIKDAYEDPRFNQEVDKKTGYRTHSILCMPILNFEGEVVGVAQIINKVSGDHAFQVQDVEVFRKYLIFCGLGITNAQLFELSVQEYKRNQLLLNLARGIFKEQSNLEKLVQKIMLEAQDLLKCERCTVYLCENTFTLNESGTSMNHDVRKVSCAKEVIFSTVFDLFAKDEGCILYPSPLDLSKSKNAEIAKHVVLTGNVLNISDIDMDGRFGNGPFVEENGFKTKNLLCMPICNSERQIFGVTQLMNKKNREGFGESDTNIMEAFAIFTGLGIHNCQMYETAVKLMAKQKVALEVLSFHATASTEETDKLENALIPSVKELRLDTFEFNDLLLDDDETLKGVISIFNEVGILNEFKIPYDVICRWTCSVKKNYRPVIYHNWRHAFNVAQSMYTMVITGGLSPVFDKLDLFCLLVACLCHDLDHRGTNNAFQVKAASPLALLYSTSVMEHHHFDHCIMILNSEGNNIFAGLSADEYRQGINILEHAILSTDLALYFRKRGDFMKIMADGDVDFSERVPKELLMAMMMTACDVAAITKPWEIQQNVAQLVANEFFEQGDIEKEEFGEKPIDMMDREKKEDLPRMQVGFIDAICIPVYQMFAELNPKLSPMYNGVQNNRSNWKILADKVEQSKEKKIQKSPESSKNGCSDQQK